MMVDLDENFEQKEEDDLDEAQYRPGMPYQEMCLVDDTDDLPVGIQGVPFTNTSEKMIKTSKNLGRLTGLFEEQCLQDRGYLSLNNLQLLPPADEKTIAEANKLKQQVCPQSRLFPELINGTICWVSKEGVNQLEIHQALKVQDMLGRKSVLLNTGGHGGAGNMNPSNVDMMGSSKSIAQDSELARMSTCEVAMHIC